MSGFYPSWVTVGAGYGITVTEEQFYAYGGWPLPEIVKDLHKKCLGTDATDAFVDEFLAKKRVVREQQEKERGPPAAIDPVVAVARAHVAAGIPIYAVSMPTAPPAQPQCYAAQLRCYAVSMPQRSDAHLHSRHASTSGICHVTNAATAMHHPPSTPSTHARTPRTTRHAPTHNAPRSTRYKGNFRDTGRCRAPPESSRTGRHFPGKPHHHSC